MKKQGLFGLIILAMAIFCTAFITQIQELPIDAALPMKNYKMKDVSGKMLRLSDVTTKKGILVIFSCNTCPYVKLSEARIKTVSEFCIKNEIGCVLVNSNEAQRTEEDSFEAMQNYYKNQDLKCAYTVDEKSQLADAFGATRTPQCFLFNQKGLVYKGAIDDNVKDVASVKVSYLQEALEALLRGEAPSLQQTKSIGCTIKRNE